MQPAAPAPEDHRDRARADALADVAPRDQLLRRRHALRRGGATRVSAPSSSWSTSARGERVRLHRGQSAAAGRAHGHRGGDRPRSGAHPAARSPAARRCAELGLRQATCRRRAAIALQARINLETMARRRRPRSRPAACSPPTSRRPGRACASMASATAGYRTSARYDSLLAKLIVHCPTIARDDGAKRLPRARRIPDRRRRPPTSPSCGAAGASRRRDRRTSHTRFVEEHIAELLAEAAAPTRLSRGHARAAPGGRQSRRVDPLAVLAHGKPRAGRPRAGRRRCRPDGTTPLRAPLQGTIVSLAAKGDAVRAGQPVLDHGSHEDGARDRRRRRGLRARDRRRGRRHGVRGPSAGSSSRRPTSTRRRAPRRRRSISTTSAPTSPRCSTRHAPDLDAARPEAVARRRKTKASAPRARTSTTCSIPAPSSNTARSSSPRQRRRHTMEELIEQTPGRRAGDGPRPRQRRPVPGEDAPRCAVMAYDYTVLAGTQGATQPPEDGPHARDRRELAAADRVLHRGRRRAARRHRRSAAGLNTPASGFCSASCAALVPLVGIISGRCFAGNAALARLLRRDHRHQGLAPSAWAARR